MLSDLPSHCNYYLTGKLLDLDPEDPESNKKLDKLVEEGKLRKKTGWTFDGSSILHYMATEREVKKKVVEELKGLVQQLISQVEKLTEAVDKLQTTVTERDKKEWEK